MRLVLTGGKTGGHIFPLIRIKNMVQKNNPTLEIVYYGLKDSLEEKVCNKDQSIVFRGLDIPKNGFSMKYLKLYYKEYKNVLKEFKAYKDVVVVSTGGFVSLIILLVCRRLKIKYILLEENMVMGKVNKLFYKKAYKLCLTFPIADLNGKNITLTGNPSSEFKTNPKAFNFDISYKYILVLGGSGGSNILTDLAINLSKNLSEDFKVILIASKTYESIKHQTSSKLIIYDFVDDLPSLLNKVNYVVLRAGSSSLCECLALEKNMIVIPSLSVKDNHQYQNAKYLLDNNCCMYLDERSVDVDVLEKTILALDKDIQKRSLLKISCRKIKIEEPCKNVYFILKELLV